MSQPSELPPSECYRCGYDLRGIANDQPCPECGLLVERSRRLTDELHNTRPRWLRSIAWGSNLILLSILWVCFWSVFVGNNLGAIASNVSLNHPSFDYWGFDFAALILLFGIVLLTRPENYPPADLADRRLRSWLRLAALLLVAAAAIQWINFLPNFGRFNFQNVNDDNSYPTLLDSVGLFVSFSSLPVLLFLRFRSLAVRARSAHLAEHCLIVGIGASFCAFCAFAFYFAKGFCARMGIQNSWEDSSGMLVIAALLTTGVVLFVLWSFYLLVRFAISFNRAARQLRRQWKRDDRAAPTGLPT